MCFFLWASLSSNHKRAPSKKATSSITPTPTPPPVLSTQSLPRLLGTRPRRAQELAARRKAEEEAAAREALRRKEEELQAKQRAAEEAPAPQMAVVVKTVLGSHFGNDR